MDKYCISIGREKPLEDYFSVETRNFSYSEFTSLGRGIQTSRDCTPEYEEALIKLIQKVKESLNDIKVLDDNFGFINGGSPEREIESLHERCIREINSSMDIVTFADVEELKDTFQDIFAHKSHIKDYVLAALVLDAKGINLLKL